MRAISRAGLAIMILSGIYLLHPEWPGTAIYLAMMVGAVCWVGFGE